MTEVFYFGENGKIFKTLFFQVSDRKLTFKKGLY